MKTGAAGVRRSGMEAGSWMSTVTPTIISVFAVVRLCRRFGAVLVSHAQARGHHHFRQHTDRPLIAEHVSQYGILQDAIQRVRFTVEYRRLADQSNPVAVVGITGAMHRAQRLNRVPRSAVPSVNRNLARVPG